MGVLTTLFCDTPHTPHHSPYHLKHHDFGGEEPRTPVRSMNEFSVFSPLHMEAMDMDSPSDTTRRPPAQRTRKQRPNSIAVDTIFAINGANSSRRPPPAEHLPGSPSQRVSFESPQISGSPTKSAHARSKSVMDSPRRLNRLSMSFPVLPPTAGSSRPTSWANSPVVSPAEPSPSAEGNFLTQLASQERKVLELKEALRQAEVELDRLKRHWASHEALKKRADVRRVQALQPLSANLSSLETSEDDVDGSSQWLQKEMERRKALLSGIKTSNRKVFSGSKHTRTLSLLSPEKTQFSQPFPQPTDLRRSEDNPYRSPIHDSRPTVNAHADTLSQLEGQPKDMILRTGKQMASDIKDGLWTFFEDIRQATIGEEATMTPDATNTPTANAKPKPLRRSNTTGAATTRNARPAAASRTSSSTAAGSITKRDTRHDTLIDIGGSFWRENGIETPIPASKSSNNNNNLNSHSQQHKHKHNNHSHKKAHSLKAVGVKQPLLKKSDVAASSELTPSGASDAANEEWDTWDTPGKETSTTPVPSSRKSKTTTTNVDMLEEHDNESDDTSSEQADSASDGIGTPLTDEHSRQTPRTSTSSAAGKRNSIPWPDLEKLTPSSLKRTASHLMKEWERSMTPSPSPSEIEGLAYDSTPGFGSSAMSAKTDKSD